MRRFGLFILDNYKWLTAGIVILSVFFSFFTPTLRIEEDESTWFSENDPILKTYHEYQEVFVTNETAVIAYTTPDALDGKELKYLSELTAKLEKMPYVMEAISLTTVDDILGSDEGLTIESLVKRRYYKEHINTFLKERIDKNIFLKNVLISDDYRTFSIILLLEWTDEDKDEAGDLSRVVTKALKGALNKESEKSGRRFYLGGNVITDAEVSRMMERDMYSFFPLSLLLAAIILLVIFRDLFSIIFPLISVSLALMWTLGLKGIFNSPITPVSTTLFALINVIGIANSVHLISHFNQIRHLHTDLREALLETFERAGSACLYTSITTAFGFGSLCISPLPVIRDMGLFAAFGIMSAFILSIILVSTGLMLFKKGKKSTTYRKMYSPKKLLHRISTINCTFSRGIIIIALALSALMLFGIPRIEVESSMLEYLKKNSTLRNDAEFLDSVLVGISSIEVVLQGEEDTFKNPQTLRKIDALHTLAMTHPKVSATHSLVDYLKLIFRALNSDSSQYYIIPETREAVAQSLLLYEMSGGNETEDFVTTSYDMARVSISTKQMKQQQRTALLDDITEYCRISFPDISCSITGFDNLVHHTTERIVSTQIRSLSLAILVIMVLMCILFGIKGGLLSVLPNVFPIIFLLGLMGYAGFHLDIATSIIASIAIGIVVDDTIHYFFHYKHELLDCHNGEQAMTNAHQNVGSALCCTSLILALGFLVFLLSETRILYNYGLLSCVAVIVALCGDLFVGPVLLMKLKVFKK